MFLKIFGSVILDKDNKYQLVNVIRTVEILSNESLSLNQVSNEARMMQIKILASKDQLMISLNRFETRFHVILIISTQFK